jgi:hypothetical protein
VCSQKSFAAGDSNSFVFQFYQFLTPISFIVLAFLPILF